METVEGFPFRGYSIFARDVRQPSGHSTATVTIHEGGYGEGPTRYVAYLVGKEFETDALAKDNALREATEWIYKFPLGE